MIFKSIELQDYEFPESLLDLLRTYTWSKEEDRGLIMEEFQRRYIIDHCGDLIKNIHCTTAFLANLRQSKVLSEEERQEVSEKRTTQIDKTDYLLRILQTKVGGFQSLIAALKETQQSGAIKILERASKSDSCRDRPARSDSLSVTQRRSPFRTKWRTQSSFHYERRNKSQTVIFQKVKVEFGRLVEIYADSTGESEETLLELFDHQQSNETLEIAPAPISPRNLDAYHNRRFTSNRKISTRLLESVGDDIFILQGIERYDFTSLVEKFPCKFGLSGVQFNNGNLDTVVYLEALDSFNQFCRRYDEFVKQPNRKNVHLLHCKKDRLDDAKDPSSCTQSNITYFEWICTHGSTRTLAKYALSSQDSVDEEHIKILHTSFSKHICIVGKTGTGKTQFLYKCARELLNGSSKNRLRYVIYLPAANLFEKLNVFRCSNVELCRYTVAEAIALCVCDENMLQFMFLYGLLTSHVKRRDLILFEIMLDGIDDLSWEEASSFLNAIRLLSHSEMSTNLRIWITVKPFYSDMVEDALSTVCYRIEDLTSDECLNVLKPLKIPRVMVDKVAKLAEADYEDFGMPLLLDIIRFLTDKDGISAETTAVLCFQRFLPAGQQLARLFEMYFKLVELSEESALALQVYLSRLSSTRFRVLFQVLAQSRTRPSAKTPNVGAEEMRTIRETVSVLHGTCLDFFAATCVFEDLDKFRQLIAKFRLTNKEAIKGTEMLLALLDTTAGIIEITKLGQTELRVHNSAFKCRRICFFLNYLIENIDTPADFAILLTRFALVEPNTAAKLYNTCWNALFASICRNLGKFVDELLQCICALSSLVDRSIRDKWEGENQKGILTAFFLAARYAGRSIFIHLCASETLLKQTQLNTLVIPFLAESRTLQHKSINLLHVAAESCNVEVMKLLFNKYDASSWDFEPMSRNYSIFSYFYHCLTYNEIDISRTPQRKIEALILLNSKFEINRNWEHFSHLMFENISLTSLQGLLQIFTEHKARRLPLVKTSDGDNIFHLVAKFHYGLITPHDFHKFLLTWEKCFDMREHLETRNASQWRAIEYAASSIELLEETLQFCQQTGVILSAADEDKSTIIYKAVAGFISPNPLKLLMAYVQQELQPVEGIFDAKTFTIRPGLIRRTNDQQTILHHAAMHRHLDAVVFFREYHGDLNINDDFGNTPLHTLFGAESKPHRSSMMQRIFSLLFDSSSIFYLDCKATSDLDKTSPNRSPFPIFVRCIERVLENSDVRYKFEIAHLTCEDRITVTCTTIISAKNQITIRVVIPKPVSPSERSSKEKIAYRKMGKSSGAGESVWGCFGGTGLLRDVRIRVQSGNVTWKYDIIRKRNQPGSQYLWIQDRLPNQVKNGIPLDSDLKIEVKTSRAKYGEFSIVVNLPDYSNTEALHSCWYPLPKTRVSNKLPQRTTFKPKAPPNLEMEPDNQNKIAKFLIAKSANIGAPNAYGFSSLHYAMQLCESGLSVEEKLELQKYSAFIFLLPEKLTLALKGLLLNPKMGVEWHPEIFFIVADALVEQGADVTFIDPSTRMSFLDQAAGIHSVYAVEYLTQNQKFQTVFNHDSAAKALLNMNCSQKCSNKKGCRLIRFMLNSYGHTVNEK